uniref:Uncharacterized protein n=1 Tax=Anopheles melas TaxID=34690 RepID=A0A182TP95_9DIPT
MDWRSVQKPPKLGGQLLVQLERTLMVRLAECFHQRSISFTIVTNLHRHHQLRSLIVLERSLPLQMRVKIRCKLVKRLTIIGRIYIVVFWAGFFRFGSDWIVGFSRFCILFR